VNVLERHGLPTLRPLPVRGSTSPRTSTACFDSTTMCSVSVFVTLNRQSADWMSTSAHRARRSSPGPTNTSGASRSAQRTTNVPSYPSPFRRNSPTSSGAVPWRSASRRSASWLPSEPSCFRSGKGSVCQKTPRLVTALARSLKRNIGIDTKRKPFFLASEAVLQSPPLAAGRRNLEGKPSGVVHPLRFVSRFRGANGRRGKSHLGDISRDKFATCPLLFSHLPPDAKKPC